MTGVTFVIHQSGAASDGGVTSIGEILARAPLQGVRIITNRSSEPSAEWSKYGEVAVWPMAEGGYHEPPSLARPLFRAANNARMFFDVRRNRTRVVHVNDRHALCNTAFGAKLGGAKIVFNVRDSMRKGTSRRRWRFFLRISDRFLVLSKEMEIQWREQLAPLPPRGEQKFRRLYSIVDRNLFSPATIGDRTMLRLRLGADPQRPLLVYPARFEEKKAQLAFIREALPQIVHGRRDVVVHFVGDFSPAANAYAAACLRAAHELELENHVRFTGYSPRVADWYRVADLVLLASLREGLARCMVESIACGTPVVSFAVCSAREILEEHQAGVVVPMRNYSGLAHATLALLGDEHQRAALSRQGPKVAAELFDPERVAGAYAALVNELVPPLPGRLREIAPTSR